MTTILGIDPGVTSGWCLYDSGARAVLGAGLFAGFDITLVEPLTAADIVVLERPVGMGPTRPAMVDCGYIAGRLAEKFAPLWLGRSRELTRLQVKKALTAATMGEVQVRTDATAWAALLELHGGADAAKKGGPLHGVKAHGRAALAVAVALALLVAA